MYNEDGENKFMNKQIERAKEYMEHTWLMHREYIIGGVVGFFLINEKPTSSKDPFALRRSAIGLLRIIIENKLSIRLRDLINYAIRLYDEQGVEVKNEKTEMEVLDFLKERMRNILKLKNIKIDIIEASISSHTGDNFLDLYKKNLLIFLQALDL